MDGNLWTTNRRAEISVMGAGVERGEDGWRRQSSGNWFPGSHSGRKFWIGGEDVGPRQG